MTPDSGVTQARSCILGIETSGQETALALIASNQLPAGGDQQAAKRVYSVSGSVHEATAARHNERIFDLLTRLFESAGIDPGQLSGVGVSIGPGMFSALRVGLAVAKGLAMSLGIPVKGISTLDALVLTVLREMEARPSSKSEPMGDADARAPRAILPVIDAHKNEVYWAQYRGAIRSGDFQLGSPDELGALVPGEVAICGSGLAPYRTALESAFGPRAQMLDIEYPAPVVIALEAAWAFEQGNADDYENLSPLYLRRTEAEIQREKNA